MSKEAIERVTNAAIKAWNQAHPYADVPYDAWLKHQKEVLGFFWGA